VKKRTSLVIVLALAVSLFVGCSDGEGEDGKLYALDSVIQQDKYDIEGIHPAIRKLLRDKGNGKLFGLSPTFNSSALYYNIVCSKNTESSLQRTR
jgi:hypothetical protein